MDLRESQSPVTTSQIEARLAANSPTAINELETEFRGTVRRFSTSRKKRQRKKYPPEKRIETAQTRKDKACDSCRRKRIRCNQSHRKGQEDLTAPHHIATSQPLVICPYKVAQIVNVDTVERLLDDEETSPCPIRFTELDDTEQERQKMLLVNQHNLTSTSTEFECISNTLKSGDLNPFTSFSNSGDYGKFFYDGPNYMSKSVDFTPLAKRTGAGVSLSSHTLPMGQFFSPSFQLQSPSTTSEDILAGVHSSHVYEHMVHQKSSGSQEISAQSVGEYDTLIPQKIFPTIYTGNQTGNFTAFSKTIEFRQMIPPANAQFHGDVHRPGQYHTSDNCTRYFDDYRANPSPFEIRTACNNSPFMDWIPVEDHTQGYVARSGNSEYQRPLMSMEDARPLEQFSYNIDGEVSVVDSSSAGNGVIIILDSGNR